MSKSHEEKSLTILKKYLPDAIVRYAIAPYLSKRVWEIWSEEERMKHITSDEVLIYALGNTICEEEYPSMKLIRKTESEYTIGSIHKSFKKHEYIIAEVSYNNNSFRLRLWNRISNVSYFFEFDEDNRTDVFDKILVNEKYVIAYCDIGYMYAFDYKSRCKLWRKNNLRYTKQHIMLEGDTVIIIRDDRFLETWDAKTGENKTTDRLRDMEIIGFKKNSHYLVYLSEYYRGYERITVIDLSDTRYSVKHIDLIDDEEDCRHTRDFVLSHDNKFVRITEYPYFLEVWNIDKGVKVSEHLLSDVAYGRISKQHVVLTEKRYLAFFMQHAIIVYDLRYDVIEVIDTDLNNFYAVHACPWNTILVRDNSGDVIYKTNIRSAHKAD